MAVLPMWSTGLDGADRVQVARISAPNLCVSVGALPVGAKIDELLTIDTRTFCAGLALGILGAI
jgi:hypothetical protein